MYREYPKVNFLETLEYSRKSRSDDPLIPVEDVLAKHGVILDDYAKSNLGGSIPEENKYREVGSSETIDGRPRMLALLKAVESPAIKAVLVVDVQRLSRGDLEDAGRLIRILRYTNTLVITPNKTYDLRDEYDRDAFERELKRGNEYLEYFKKVQYRGKIASLKEGNYVGSKAPYGYDKISTKEGNKTCHILVIKEEEAAIVRKIFEWYCNDDIGPTMICNRLDEMGIRTPTKKPHWSTSMVNHILQNIHYIGCVRWNWRKTIITIEDQEIKKIRNPRKNVDEYLIYEGKHEPIISKETFELAQKIRGKRYRAKPQTTLRNPFVGLMFCKCGASMGYHTYNIKGVETHPPRMRCNQARHCRTGSASFKEVLEYITNALREMLEDFEVRVTRQEDDSVKLHLNLIKSLTKRLEDLNKKELLQWEAQYDPDESKRLPQHIFQKLNEKLLLEKEEINNALCAAKDSQPQRIDYKERVLKFTDALDALEDPNIPINIKNRFLKDIIDRIEYERPENKKLALKGVRGAVFDKKPFTITIYIKA